MSCRDQVVVLRDRVARVRADPTLFFVRPRHEVTETEEVVLKQLEFWIVRKLKGFPRRSPARLRRRFSRAE